MNKLRLLNALLFLIAFPLTQSVSAYTIQFNNKSKESISFFGYKEVATAPGNPVIQSSNIAPGESRKIEVPAGTIIKYVEIKTPSQTCQKAVNIIGTERWEYLDGCKITAFIIGMPPLPR